MRHRCAELLPAAGELDLRARIETFLADTNGDYEHDLPAWKAFRAIACREWSVLGQVVWSNRALEKPARQIFVELIADKDNRRLMMAVEDSRFELSDIVAMRRQELYNRRYLAHDETTSRSPHTRRHRDTASRRNAVGSQYSPRRGSISTLLSVSGFTKAAREPDAKGQVYRSIAIAWLNSRNDPRDMYQAMSIASSLDLNDQVCSLAVRLFTMPGATASYRSRAASYLVNAGSKRHVRLLEKTLTSETVVQTVQIRGRQRRPIRTVSAPRFNFAIWRAGCVDFAHQTGAERLRLPRQLRRRK